MNELKPGDFVRYLPKNELGLVGRVDEGGAFVWYHTGGTRAHTGFDMMEPICALTAIESRFNNEYAKASLFERQARLKEGKDVTDLIDDKGIRESISHLRVRAQGWHEKRY